jgi:signal transduction histidine kinase/ActR/RegA family two-component response regulator
MHPLLTRQLARVRQHSVDGAIDPTQLCEVVSQTYEDSDRERRLAERATKLMEEELLAVNASLEERVRARTQDLLDAKDQAEVANRSKSDFLAMMSHELRTPLSGILGMIDIATETTTSNEIKEILVTARSCSNSLLAILNDILDLSKLESGKLDLEFIDFDLGVLVSEVAIAFAVEFKRKNLDLVVNIEEGLPTRLHSDPSRLRQVLFNLVGNALKFTEVGSICIQVGGVTIGGERYLEIKVTDSGEGIPLEVQSRLFTPFQQGDASINRRKGGTGLGLSICRQLLHLMHGEIGFTSTPGVGTTFWFDLPLREATGDSSEIQRPSDRPTVTPTTPLLMRILVAEDNAINQRIIRRILEKAGCSVELVENGEEAVTLVQAKPFDLVLMDIQMPIMDGGTATQEIRKLHSRVKNIPIVGLSANALKGDQEQYLALGMDEYLTKPIDRDKLLQILVRLQHREHS